MVTRKMMAIPTCLRRLLKRTERCHSYRRPGRRHSAAKIHRRTATTPAASAFLPLKSALKKPAAAPEALGRQATYPAAYPSQPASRPRLHSNNFRGYTSDHNHEDFRPLHMFMLFIGNNELRLENIMDPAMRELRATILPMWPDGVEADSQHGHDWTVRFRNNPWVFKDLMHQCSAVNLGSPSPRLVFEVTSEDRTSHFFLAYFSRGGRRLTLIKPPAVVDDTLGSQLKAYLPRKITEESVGDDMRVIEVKRLGTSGPEVEPQFFLMHVLKVLSELGFNLVTGVPLGRKGPLGLRAGKELLVFRGTGSPDLKT
ncbi:hypothetical protein LshimejAT787_0304250 [Lyophyllum shimeji]|uniref:Uncharacterized protein n=1 Tax=Lyophyllum shimeji TaxID=47721 RepID=A0A9P3PIU5_LYOSH|nr:hypothetical protein LshimejAT787_0304250 [Lyophyllum shimeji]